MKKHLSVLMLLSRSTIYQITGLYAVLFVAETVLFYFALGAHRSLEQTVTHSKASFVFGACFLLITVLLCRTGCEFGGRQGYTLRRLSVSGHSLFLWQAAYNVCCYFILWAVQLAAALAFCGLYTAKTDPALLTGQTVFLAFYRSSFLHSLLPLGEVSRWVCSAVFIVCLGTTAACFPVRQRRGQKPVAAAVAAVVASVFFQRELGSTVSDVFLSAVMLIIVAVTAAEVWKEPDYED